MESNPFSQNFQNQFQDVQPFLDEIGDKIRADKTDNFIDRFTSDVFEIIDED
jgi:hypothetical protein